MEIDTVASAGTPGFDTLGITPQPIERVLEQLLGGVQSRPQPLASSASSSAG